MTDTAAIRPTWPLAMGIGLWAAAVAVAPGMLPAAFVAAPVVLAALAWWLLAGTERWIAAYLSAALLLPPLPVGIGDSGPHPALVIVLIGMLCGLVRLRRWRLPDSSAPAAPLLAFFAILLASVGSAAIYSGVEAAAGSLSRVMLFGIAVYLFLYTAGLPPVSAPDPLRQVRLIYWVAVTAAVFACIDFYYQLPAPAGFGPQFVWLDSGVYRRAQGLFYEASTLGNFCAFFVVMIAVAAVYRPRGFLPWPALLAGGAVFLTALMLSFSRASLVNVLTAFAVLAASERRRITHRSIVIAVVICVLGLAVAALMFPAFARTYWFRISATAEYLFTSTEGVLSGRVASWRSLLDLARQNPLILLFGVGYKTLPYTHAFGAPVVADNMYLSLLVETGLAGVFAVGCLNVSIIKTARRAALARDSRTAFLGTWMLCFWSGQMVQMLSGDLLTYWRVLGLYFWVLALAVRRMPAMDAA